MIPYPGRGPRQTVRKKTWPRIAHADTCIKIMLTIMGLNLSVPPVPGTLELPAGGPGRASADRRKTPPPGCHNYLTIQ